MQSIIIYFLEETFYCLKILVICDVIRQGHKSGLDAFANQASLEVVSAGVATAAELILNKAFKQRFADVLMGACLNLTSC